MLNSWLNYTYGPEYKKLNIYKLYNPIIKFLGKGLMQNYQNISIFIKKKMVCLGISDETSNTAGFMQNAIFTLDQMIQGNYTEMERGLVDVKLFCKY